VPQAPRRGAAPEGDGAAFEDEEQDGLEDLATGAPALRFGRDLRLLEVRLLAAGLVAGDLHPMQKCPHGKSCCGELAQELVLTPAELVARLLIRSCGSAHRETRLSVC